MKAIDKLKEMQVEELAHLLRKVDIDDVVKWCDGHCPKTVENCRSIEKCIYDTVEGNERAWTEFLQMEVDGDVEFIRLADLIDAVDARLNNGEDLPPMTAGDFIKLAKSQHRYKLDSTALVNL